MRSVARRQLAPNDVSRAKDARSEHAAVSRDTSVGTDETELRGKLPAPCAVECVVLALAMLVVLVVAVVVVAVAAMAVAVVALSELAIVRSAVVASVPAAEESAPSSCCWMHCASISNWARTRLMRLIASACCVSVRRESSLVHGSGGRRRRRQRRKGLSGAETMCARGVIAAFDAAAVAALLGVCAGVDVGGDGVGTGAGGTGEAGD
eukprot:6188650-Pleurochrysis_carterae.AAC.1